MSSAHTSCTTLRAMPLSDPRHGTAPHVGDEFLVVAHERREQVGAEGQGGHGGLGGGPRMEDYFNENCSRYLFVARCRPGMRKGDHR